MNKTEIIEILQGSIMSEDIVQIERNKIDRHPITCIPMQISEELLYIQYLYDFQFDGYKIVRLKDLTNVRISDIEIFIKKILIEEAIYDQTGNASKIALDGWEKMFRDFILLGKNIIVEGEKKINSSFNIGKIIEVNTKSIVFLGFDALGEWDQKPTVIPFKDITSVTIDGRYLTTISKYTS